MIQYGFSDGIQIKFSFMDPDRLYANAQRGATLLKALANRNRLLILCQLLHGEKSVSEIESGLSLSQSAISQHLARLKTEKLVAARREKRTVYYSLKGEEAPAVLKTLYALYCHDEKGESCS